MRARDKLSLTRGSESPVEEEEILLGGGGCVWFQTSGLDPEEQERT